MTEESQSMHDASEEVQAQATAAAVAESEAAKEALTGTEGAAPAADQGKSGGDGTAKPAVSEAASETVLTAGELTAVRSWTELQPEDLAAMPAETVQKIVAKCLQAQSSYGRKWSEVGRAMQRARTNDPANDPPAGDDQESKATRKPSITIDPDQLGEEGAKVLTALLNRIETMEARGQEAEEMAEFQEVDAAIAALSDAKALGLGEGSGANLPMRGTEMQRRAEIVANAKAIRYARGELGVPITMEEAVDLAVAATFPNRRPAGPGRIRPTATSRAATSGHSRAQTSEEETIEALKEQDAKNPVRFFTS